LIYLTSEQRKAMRELIACPLVKCVVMKKYQPRLQVIGRWRAAPKPTSARETKLKMGWREFRALKGANRKTKRELDQARGMRA
jgi:hypothetical protein